MGSTLFGFFKRFDKCLGCNLFGHWDWNNRIDEELVEGFLASRQRGGVTFSQLKHDINECWRAGIRIEDAREVTFVPGLLSWIFHREENTGIKRPATVNELELERILNSLREQGRVIRAKADVRDPATNEFSKQETWARLCHPRNPPQPAHVHWDDLEDLGPQRLKRQGTWLVTDDGPCAYEE